MAEPPTAEPRQAVTSKVQKSIEITYKEGKCLRINPDKLRSLLIKREIGDKPIAIISIAGTMRTGKSFILNFFIRYFRGRGWENPDWIEDDSAMKSEGFTWSKGSDRCTTGIGVYEEIFEVPIHGEEKKMIVILMDTQGLFDLETDANVNNTLLTLSTLASSVQIFNAMRYIDASHLKYLKTCVDFALATASSNHYLKLQRMMFLVRDYPGGDIFDGIDISRILEHGEDYLDKFLSKQHGTDELKEIQKGIKTSFEDLACFVLPYPGNRVERKSFNGANKDLDSEFLECVKIFVEETANPKRLLPKASNEKKLTGRQIFNMLVECDKRFSDNMFKVTSMMEANEKAYYTAECEAAIIQYDSIVQSHISGGDSYTEEKLYEFHEIGKKMAKRRYSTVLPLGNAKLKAEFKEHLEKKMEEHFKLTMDQNKANEKFKKAAMVRHAREAFWEYEKEMKKFIKWGMADDKLESFHKDTYQKVRLKYETSADLDRLDKDIETRYGKIVKENKQHRKEQEEAERERRSKKLHQLVWVELKDKCTKMWAKHSESFRDPEEIGPIGDEIRKELIDEFWVNALKTEEMNYLQVLEYGMKKEYENVTGRKALHERGTMKKITPSSRTADEGKYGEKVMSIMKEFSRELRNKGEKIIEDEYFRLWQTHRNQFLDFCSTHIVPYFNSLESIVKEEEDEAQENATKSFAILEEDIRNAVDKFVLDLETRLQELMRERYISDKTLSETYKTTEREIVSEIVENYGKALKECDRARRIFEETLSQKLEVSRKKMLECNATNKNFHQMSTVLPDRKESSGLFKRAWNFFRGL